MKRMIVAFALSFFGSFLGLIVFYGSAGKTEQKDRTVASHETGGPEFDCGARLKVSGHVCPEDSGKAIITNLPEECYADDYKVKWMTEDGVKLMKDEEMVPEGQKKPLTNYKKVDVVAEDGVGTKQNVEITAELTSKPGTLCEDCGTATATTDVGCKLEVTDIPSVMNVGDEKSFKVKYMACGHSTDTCDIRISADDSLNIYEYPSFIGGGQEKVKIKPSDTGTYEVKVDANSECFGCGVETFQIKVCKIRKKPRRQNFTKSVPVKVSEFGSSIDEIQGELSGTVVRPGSCRVVLANLSWKQKPALQGGIAALVNISDKLADIGYKDASIAEVNAKWGVTQPSIKNSNILSCSCPGYEKKKQVWELSITFSVIAKLNTGGKITILSGKSQSVSFVAKSFCSRNCQQGD